MKKKHIELFALLCLQRRHPCSAMTVGSPEYELCFPTIHVMSVFQADRIREKERNNSSEK